MCAAPPNAPDQRCRANNLPIGTTTSSRHSVHPACWTNISLAHIKVNGQAQRDKQQQADGKQQLGISPIHAKGPTISLSHSRRGAKLRRSPRAADLPTPQKTERSAAVGCRERVERSRCAGRALSGVIALPAVHNLARALPTASLLLWLSRFHRVSHSQRCPLAWQPIA